MGLNRSTIYHVVLYITSSSHLLPRTHSSYIHSKTAIFAHNQRNRFRSEFADSTWRVDWHTHTQVRRGRRYYYIAVGIIRVLYIYMYAGVGEGGRADINHSDRSNTARCTLSGWRAERWRRRRSVSSRGGRGREENWDVI